jgi:ubiquinol-cytochrome c reductase cytochrome c subunit
MPLRGATGQPARHSPFYTPRELDALVAFVASLGRGPRVPAVHPERGSVAEGLHTFTRFCAGCHQIVGRGGVVVGGSAPALDRATPTQIAEAVRIGPYLMPRFGPRLLSDREVDSLVRYIEYARHPQDPGGWSLGRIGPVPEGAVAWLVGAAVLVGVAALIGSRAR